MTNDSTTYSHNILLARTGRHRAGSSPEEIASLCQALQQEFPGDIYRQICDLYSLVAMPSATGRGPRKGREVSHKTLTRHFMAIRKFLSTLKEKNIHPKNMNEMSTKHVRIAVQAWEQQGMTAGTMSTNYSCLKRLYLLAFGKALPPIKEFLIDKEAATRNYSAVKSKDWESNGVDVNEKVAMAESICKYTALMLRLSRSFGLRLLECLELRPLEADLGDRLLINRGAKGGRGRAIPIETPEQRELLEEAKRLAHPRWGYLAKTKDLAKNRRHAYYVLEQIGIGRRGDGVTFHGLRHQYVQDAFERLTGEAAPVRGGQELDRAKRKKVALELMERTGHGRENVATAYLGSHRHLRRTAALNIRNLIDDLECNQGLRDWFETKLLPLQQVGKTAALLVVGPQAEGNAVGEDMPLLLRLQIWPRDDINLVFGLLADAQAVLPAVLGKNCVIGLGTDTDSGPTLEIFAHMKAERQSPEDQQPMGTKEGLAPHPAP